MSRPSKQTIMSLPKTGNYTNKIQLGKIMFIGHKITVCKRLIAYDFKNRHDKHRAQRRQRIKDCIKSIRRLQNNPTNKDLYNNPVTNI